MKDTLVTGNNITEKAQNFLDILKNVLGKIDFDIFPKGTNQERFERISDMYNKLSQEEKSCCAGEYLDFLERLGKKLPKDVAQEVNEIVNSLLQENEFENLKDFTSLKDYLASDAGQNDWNPRKLHAFLFQLYTIGKNIPGEERTILFTMLFHISNFKGCSWNERNLILFSEVIKHLKGDFRVQARELFLSLPNIKNISNMERIGKYWEIILQGPKSNLAPQKGFGSNFGGGNWGKVIARIPVK